MLPALLCRRQRFSSNIVRVVAQQQIATAPRAGVAALELLARRGELLLLGEVREVAPQVRRIRHRERVGVQEDERVDVGQLLRHVEAVGGARLEEAAVVLLLDRAEVDVDVGRLELAPARVALRGNCGT